MTKTESSAAIFKTNKIPCKCRLSPDRIAHFGVIRPLPIICAIVYKDRSIVSVLLQNCQKFNSLQDMFCHLDQATPE